MNRLIAFALFAVTITAFAAPQLQPAGADDDERRAVLVAGDPQAEPTAAAYLAESDDATVIRRDSSGQFHIGLAVNGQDTRFLVDTGADVVALSVAEAERLGLAIDPQQFQPLMRTASGVGYGTVVTLERIELGDREIRNVQAVVIDGLEMNLLGQNLLRELGSLQLQGDRMVLRHG